MQQLPPVECDQEGPPLSDPLPPDNTDLLATLQAAAAGLEPATTLLPAIEASPQSSQPQIAKQSQSESAAPREQQQSWRPLGSFRQARRAARQPKPQQGSAPAAPQLGSLWEAAAEKAQLHAIVMRFVRFSSGPKSTAPATSNLAHAVAADIRSSEGEPEAVPSRQQTSSDATSLGGSHDCDDLQSTLREQAQLLLQQRSSGVKGWSATRPSPRQQSLIAGRLARGSADTAQLSGDQQAPVTIAIPAAPAVLQDMAVCAADAVAACYLAEARDGQEGRPCCRNEPAMLRCRNLSQAFSLTSLAHPGWHWACVLLHRLRDIHGEDPVCRASDQHFERCAAITATVRHHQVELVHNMSVSCCSRCCKACPMPVLLRVWLQALRACDSSLHPPLQVAQPRLNGTSSARASGLRCCIRD